MTLITPWSLFIGLVLTGPQLWRAWSDSSVDITSVLMRFVLAVLLASVGLKMLHAVIHAYRRGVGRPHRRSSERNSLDDATNRGVR